MHRIHLHGFGAKVRTKLAGKIYARRRYVCPDPESSRRRARGSRESLRRIRTFTGRVERRHDVVVSRAIGEPGVGIKGRSWRGDQCVVWATTDGTALNVIARRATDRCPAQGYLRVTGGCSETRWRRRYGGD
jgi:hypothetical protein